MGVEDKLMDTTDSRHVGSVQQLFRHKVITISMGLIVGLVCVGVVVGLSFSMNTTNTENGNVETKGFLRNTINRVPEGQSVIEGTQVWTVGTDDSVIVILPDINGNSPDAQGIARNFSQGGFTAIIIDYFNGNISFRPAANVSLFYSTNVIKNLYSRGYTDIQAQGYCYGGRVGVSLASMNNTIRTCVVAHPSSLTNDDASLIIQPMFFEMPSNDTFTNTLATYFNTTLLARGMKSVFKTYPNTTHGFAVSSTSNPAQKAIALQDSINWFQTNRLSGTTTTSSAVHVTLAPVVLLALLLAIFF